MSRLQYSSCRIERIFLLHILHALFGSGNNALPRSRYVRSRVETTVSVALLSLVDETVATLQKVPPPTSCTHVAAFVMPQLSVCVFVCVCVDVARSPSTRKQPRDRECCSVVLHR